MQECAKAVSTVFAALRSAGLALIVLSAAAPAVADDLLDALKNFRTQAQDLAKDAKSASVAARAKPFAPPVGFTMASKFAHGIADFSDLAADLSAKIDAQGGPTDLRCIYRGMAEDAKQRLTALQSAANAGAQAIVLGDMQALFEDAVDITPQNAAALKDLHDGAASGTNTASQCTASPNQKLESLP